MSRRMSRIAEDEDFMVIIEGWDCEKGEPTRKRDISDDLTGGKKIPSRIFTAETNRVIR